MKKTVLVIGRHPDLMGTVESFLKGKGYATLGVTKDQDALNHLRTADIDVVLIGGGVELASRKTIRYFAETNRPNVKILEHNGGTFKLVELVEKALKG
jgi:DNA-binding response OmpR family regulator